VSVIVLGDVHIVPLQDHCTHLVDTVINPSAVLSDTGDLVEALAAVLGARARTPGSTIELTVYLEEEVEEPEVEPEERKGIPSFPPLSILIGILLALFYANSLSGLTNRFNHNFSRRFAH